MNATPAKQGQKIKVVVVEDQPPVLKNQLKILQDAPEIEVVGTALSGEAALTLLEKQQPDVVLQDLGLPRMSGIEVTREVKKRWPGVEVLIFTIFDEEEKVIEAVKAGASGYLLKGATGEKVIDAIREVKAGGSVIQPRAGSCGTSACRKTRTLRPSRSRCRPASAKSRPSVRSPCARSRYSG